MDTAVRPSGVWQSACGTGRVAEPCQHPEGHTSILVLGAGVTGLTVAWRLAQVYPGRVVLLEKAAAVGGLAATHSKNGLSFDIGSHRLHHGNEPEVDALVQDVCGKDLLCRERRGVIYLAGRALRYPPSSFDILFAFGIWRFLRFAVDLLLARLFRRARPDATESFASFTTRKVGRSLYRGFYRPYALKLYGISPREIAKDPAVNRVRKFALATAYQDLKRKVLRKRPTYLYPAKGIGQLAATMQERFLQNGGKLIYISRVDRLTLEPDQRIRSVEFTTREGRIESVAADVVISTIPLDALFNLVVGKTDPAGRRALDLRWRSLRVLHLVSRDRLPAEHETYYFPEPSVIFGRVSELNKYSLALNPDPEETVLTVEIPCSENDDKWNMSDDELGGLCARELQRFGILKTPATGTKVLCSTKVKNVYPVYDIGWRERFNTVYQQLNAPGNLYMIGRGALFLHCNIDHCILMALKLARHLSQGGAKGEWDRTAQSFFDYRVRE
jgi:protoporphyrinogen oxidase